jgi:hypothetical protein
VVTIYINGDWLEVELLSGNGPRTRRCKAIGMDDEEEEEEGNHIYQLLLTLQNSAFHHPVYLLPQ